MSSMIKNIFLMSIFGLQAFLLCASEAAELAALDRKKGASPVSSGSVAGARGPSKGAIAASVRSRSDSVSSSVRGRSDSVSSSVRGRSDSMVSASSEFDPRAVDLSGQEVTAYGADIPASQRDNPISDEALYSSMRDYDHYYDDSRVTLPEESSMGKKTAISSKVANQLQFVEKGLDDIYNPIPRPVSVRPVLDAATGEYYYETTQAPILRWYFDIPAGKNAQTVKYTDFIFGSGGKHINGFKRVVNTVNDTEVDFLKFGLKNIRIYESGVEDGLFPNKVELQNYLKCIK